MVSGLDIYLVEQWVIDRKVGLVVAAYTGNEDNKARAIKFSVEMKQTRHYPVKFQEYLNWLAVNHARMKLKESPNLDSKVCLNEEDGEVCFVTNLASLPLYLNLIPIPGGDTREVATNFVINSNLKRLRCSGRLMLLVALKLSDANVDKFRQIYRIGNPNIPVRFAVRELVNVIQISLWYFGFLDIKYADGLLCRKTEEAIANWWTRVAMVYLRKLKRPPESEGSLPADTVAAIIGVVLLCRMRLNMAGCDVPKDPFDFENFIHAIFQFQRQKGLLQTKKLDAETMQKLFELTSNKVFASSKVVSVDDEEDTPYLSKKNRHYYSKELKKLTNVVKSTVQDHITAAGSKEEDMVNLKSGAMIRHKISKFAETTNPADVENLKLETLVRANLPGKTLNRLFHGAVKPTLPLALDMNGMRGSVMDKDPYQFQSLYYRVQLWGPMLNLTSDALRYSRRLKKMGLRKSSSAMMLKQAEPHQPSREEPESQPDLPKEARGDRVENDVADLEKLKGRPLDQLHHQLNRRNSYPVSPKDVNLNMLEQMKLDVNHDTKLLDTHMRLVRSQSCSEIDNYVLRSKVQNTTVCKFSQDYLSKLELFIRYQSLRKLYDSDISADACASTTNANVVRNYRVLNHDLYRLQMAYSQMNANKKKIIDEELQGKLEYQLNQLKSTVERLGYELRLVDKRVDELEKLISDLERSMTSEKQRLEKMIDGLVNSDGFYQIYPLAKERREIETKLLGKPLNNLDSYTIESAKESSWKAGVVVVLYNAFACLFGLFNFDRANMNLDRIRKSWIKLDPNRTLINRAYLMMGKRPSRDSVALAESIPRLEDEDDDDPMAGTFSDSRSSSQDLGAIKEPEWTPHVVIIDEEDPLYARKERVEEVNNA